MHLPDGHCHFNNDREGEEAGKQAEYDGDPSQELCPGGEVRQPSRKSQRTDELLVVVEAAENLVIAVGEHDRAQNESQHEQGEGL